MLYKKLFLAGILVFVLLSFGFVVSVEASSTTWSQAYGGANGDIAYSLVETSDGGYAIAGSTQSFGDGLSSFWLVKTDSSGNMKWNRTYGGTGGDHAYSLVETSDGGYAIAGDTWSKVTGNSDWWLVKTNVSGNVEWNRTYGGTSSETAFSLVETSDGGYAIAGYTFSFGAGEADFWLIKTDASGNVEWNRTYGGANRDIARSLVETSDGGYILAGGSLLVKTDGAGNMEWNRTYGGTCNSLITTSDRGYALAGETTGDFWLIKTDEYGSVEWSQTYGGEGDDLAESLVESSDGGFVLAGVKDAVRHQWDGHPISGNFWLVKTDASGIMEWNRTYGGTGGDHAYSLVATSDGGYALAGETGSFGAGEADFWLIKTDAYGIIPELYPPYICVGSPQNITYTTDNISLNFTVNEEASWMGYSLDGQDNVTITETTLNLTELVNGSHTLTVYATDTADTTAASETISFTIAKEKETPTSWITTAIAAAVATAGAALLIIYTKTKKKQNKK
jgi:hypothetical protein